MTTLSPLELLFDLEHGTDLPLPPALAQLFGRLQFPAHADRPYVIANMVTSLDGVVSLNVPGHSGGGDISGFNRHDWMMMGLLRTLADAIIVGAGTLHEASQHLWTAQYIFPSLADAYQTLRITLGKPELPLNVFVTVQGTIDLSLPVFQTGEVPVLIVTTTAGEQRLRQQSIPASVQLAAVQDSGSLNTHAILDTINRIRPCNIILTEGGPHLLGDFFADRTLDELFLTLAPQIAGNNTSVARPALVTDKLFAPEQPRWGTLISVRRVADHLFLRYAFEK